MSAARSRVALGLAAVVLLLGGCGDFDDTASAAQGIATNDLVSELATQLTASETLSYVAGYRMAGGATAEVARDQHPPRAAYDYPGGRVLVSADAVTLCQDGRKPTCTLTAPDAGGTPPATVFTNAEKAGMVAPGTVLALLNAAALSPDVVVTPRDTTIAGHHATCLDLTGVDHERSRAFGTCVTNDGVLGSFTGTLDGRPIDLAMTEFSSRVLPDAFQTPPGATTVDRRTPS